MAPCVNCRTVSGRPVPKPTWVSPKPAPNDWVTRSRKQTWLFLNPGVFRLARLLPTTSMAVDVAFSADSAVENDVNMRTAPFMTSDRDGQAGRGQRGSPRYPGLHSWFAPTAETAPTRRQTAYRRWAS